MELTQKKFAKALLVANEVLGLLQASGLPVEDQITVTEIAGKLLVVSDGLIETVQPIYEPSRNPDKLSRTQSG